MTQPKLVKTVFLKAPPEHVWKFLTEADRLGEWFHRAGADLKAGGEYALLTNSYGKEGEKFIWGKVLESKPFERLVHTFTHQWLKNVETTCTWTFEAVGGGTVLTLVHEGFDKLGDEGFQAAASHDAGWDEHFARLRRVTM